MNLDFFSLLKLGLDFGFQTSVTPIMEGIIDLHNHIFFFLILVFVFVSWIFGNVLHVFWWKVVYPKTDSEVLSRISLVNLRHMSHSTGLEVVWTIIPSLILVAIAIPSFALLYAMDEIMEPTLTLKVVGHQWYWSYQYSNCISQMHYSVFDYPELVPESLWNRVWSNAFHFYSRFLAFDAAYKPLSNFKNSELPKLSDKVILEEVYKKYKDIRWDSPVPKFNDCYASEHSYGPCRELYRRSKFFDFMMDARVDLPDPFDVRENFEFYRMREKLFKNRTGLDVVDPEIIPYEKLYAWIVKNYPNSIFPKEGPQQWWNTSRSYNPKNSHEMSILKPKRGLFRTIRYPSIQFFSVLDGRFSGSLVSSQPVAYYDVEWFSDLWIRKLIAGKVAEGLSHGVDLSGRGNVLPGVQFDSYMLNEEELERAGDYRLLEVDEPVVLPTNTHIRLLITADDVIHSFALPQLGVKVDAVPGRLNQQGVFIKRRGNFYGQCSELCGVNHGFMPIVVKGVSMREFVHWYLNKFDSLHPEFGMKLADGAEVSAFVERGVYPASFSEKFFRKSHEIESLVGDKSDSVFDRHPFKSVVLTHHIGFFLDRFQTFNTGTLDLNWGMVKFEEPTKWYYFGPSTDITCMENLNFYSSTPGGIAMNWSDPAVYKKVVISKPGLFLQTGEFKSSEWTRLNSELITGDEPIKVVFDCIPGTAIR